METGMYGANYTTEKIAPVKLAEAMAKAKAEILKIAKDLKDLTIAEFPEYSDNVEVFMDEDGNINVHGEHKVKWDHNLHLTNEKS